MKDDKMKTYEVEKKQEKSLINNEKKLVRSDN